MGLQVLRPIQKMCTEGVRGPRSPGEQVEYVSPSQLAMIGFCEGAYVAKYHGNHQPLPVDIPLAVGLTVHQVLDQWVLARIDGKDFSIEQVEGFITQSWRAQVVKAQAEGAEWAADPEFDHEWHVRQMTDVTFKYTTQNRDRNWVYAETQIEYETAGIPVKGFIDAVYMKGDTPVIVDFKTKGKAARKPEVREEIQLHLYSKAFEAFHGVRPRKEIHGLIWKTKSQNNLIMELPKLGEGPVGYFLKRWKALNEGAEPTLNPDTFLCSKWKCLGWVDCVFGGEK